MRVASAFLLTVTKGQEQELSWIVEPPLESSEIKEKTDL
jgi:hypothetical protein